MEKIEKPVENNNSSVNTTQPLPLAQELKKKRLAEQLRQNLVRRKQKAEQL